MSTHSPSDSRPAPGVEPVASPPGKTIRPSSPVKGRFILTNHKDIEKSGITQDAPAVQDFVEKHLSPYPREYVTDNTRARWTSELVPTITDCKGDEVEIYKPVCTLLNSISHSLSSRSFIFI